MTSLLLEAVQVLHKSWQQPRDTVAASSRRRLCEGTDRESFRNYREYTDTTTTPPGDSASDKHHHHNPSARQPAIFTSSPAMASSSSTADAALADLTPSQIEALHQFTAVTDQQPAAALPILRRSQWNVQVVLACLPRNSQDAC